ncbi:Nicotinate dehydrogenase medium molybdopterin subunit [Caloramator mitchellensis]|uniref:Nicotinate dehydrogenase medium molybdopterin subunit n=1 Tax=Caloramator mitchellensis TaxID=908809 RepID=A0A0R3JVF1_CALMK|nr:molybdopterin cofactor-binding domain-containing protein [Caloramator mitchellensis]KRQ87574.1 Nicotinate dehydrogenase medium molybdopterin subunit [Caloramator mitchellensis]
MKKRGKGIASIFYGTGYGNGFPDISRAKARLLKDGRVEVSIGATEVGQGAKTVMIQIAAEALNMDVNEIVLINEDTSITPDSGTAAASRQTYNSGNAVKLTCQNLRNRLILETKKLLKLNEDVELEVKQGKIFAKGSEELLGFDKLAKDSEKEIVECGEFKANTTQMDENGQGNPYWPYTFAACAVEVEVDTETGEIAVVDAKFSLDCGKAVNPSLVEGQIDGGFAMGVGYALMEDIGLNSGRITNGSFEKYIIPTSLDIPKVNKVIIEDAETTAPFGAKGIGEPVMIPVAPAILNAIYDAIKIRFFEIPVTPDKVLLAINEKRVV